jgi:phage-related protein
MAFEVFDPSIAPLPGPMPVEPRILRTDFGDGYSQRAADGLNSLKETLPNVHWRNVTTDEKDEIIDFMVGKGGYLPFTWTPPGETTARNYICTRWEPERVAFNVYNVTCTFEQVFDL